MKKSINDLNGAGGSVNIQRVQIFEDFLSNPTQNNFSLPTSGGSGIVASELNHPGVCDIPNNSSGGSIGFFSSLNPGAGIWIPSGFYVEVAAKRTQAVGGGTTGHVLRIGTFVSILMDSSTVKRDINNTGVFTNTGVAVPGLNVWYKLSITYTAGVLTVRLNNTIVYTATVAATSSFGFFQFAPNAAINNGNTRVDYVLINYNATR